MTEYINKQALLAEYDCVHVGPPGGARKLIEEAPTADVAPVVHGRWERHPQANDIDPVYVCNLCKLNVSSFEMRWMSYCPNCGCRMDGGNE